MRLVTLLLLGIALSVIGFLSACGSGKREPSSPDGRSTTIYVNKPARDPALTAALAFVYSRCPAPTREIDKSVWVGLHFNALYGNCRAGDGRDQHVWFFNGSRFVGMDAPKPSHYIVGVWRDGTTIAFLYVLYRQSDPECCPTGGGTIVRFRWNGKRVIRLDPLPPRAFAPGVRVGR